MATRTWDAAGASTWSVAASWSDNTKPTTDDTAAFDNTSDQNCTVDENTAILGGFTVDATYGGTIDFASANLNVLNGAVTLNGAGTFDAGDLTSHTLANCALTWMMSGGDGTWTRGTSTFTMQGASSFTGKANTHFYKLTVGTGGTLTVAGTSNYVVNVLTVNGTLDIPVAKNTGVVTTGTLVVAAAGVISGAGSFTLSSPSSGAGITSQAGTISVATLSVLNPASGSVFAAGTYASATVTISGTGAAAYVFALAAGTTTFTGDVEYKINNAGGSLTVTNAANGSQVYQGDLKFSESAGTLTYTKGTGSITFSGTAAQNFYDADGIGATNPLEDIVINKASGTLTLQDALVCDSLTLTSGTLAPNGKALTTTGSVSLGPGGSMSTGATAMNLAAWTVGGDFAATGVNLQGSGGWTLSVAGAGAIYSAVIQGCDASGSAAAIQAYNCTDGGGNTNINFTAGGAAAANSSVFNWRGAQNWRLQ